MTNVRVGGEGGGRSHGAGTGGPAEGQSLGQSLQSPKLVSVGGNRG